MGKESPCHAGDAVNVGLIPGLASLVAQGLKHLLVMQETSLIPGSGRSPREGNGNPLQYTCLENATDGGALVGYSLWDRRVTELKHGKTQNLVPMTSSKSLDHKMPKTMPQFGIHSYMDQ